MKRRLISILIALFMAFTFMPVSVTAGGTPAQITGLQWKDAVGTATWKALTTADSYNVFLWNEEKQLVTVTTETNEYNFYEEMNTYGSGYYRFMVQGVNELGKGAASEYSEEYFFLKAGDREITSLNATITPPMEGDLPDTHPVSANPDAYDVKVAKHYTGMPCWYEDGSIASPNHVMAEGQKFEKYGQYFVQIEFTPKPGYVFHVEKNDNVKLNGEAGGYKCTYEASTKTVGYRFGFVGQEKGFYSCVRFMLNPETMIREMYITKGTQLPYVSDPVWEGYYFDGWVSDDDPNEHYQFSQPVTTDILILTARFIPIVTGIQLEASSIMKYDDGTYGLKADYLKEIYKKDSAEVTLSVSPFDKDKYSYDYIKTEPEVDVKYYFMVELSSGKEGMPGAYWSEEMKTGNKIKVASAEVELVDIGHSPGGASCTMLFSYVRKPKPIPMHRLYNPNSGEHFYTGNTGEKDALVKLGWQYENIGWVAPPASSKPVYRLYNKYAGDHHYTMNAGERDALIKAGWDYENIGWYSDDNEEVPLYRQYNPNAKTGSHNYTVNKAENDALVKLGWIEEGIGWYGVK